MKWLDDRLEVTKPKEVKGMKFWKEFPLSEDEQEALTKRFLNVYDRCRNTGMRRGWIDKVRKYKDVYDQKREPVNSFLDNWDFMHVPVPTMIVDKVKNNLFNSINTPKIVSAVGVDKSDRQYDSSVTKFINFVLQKKTNFISTIDSVNRDVLVCGVGYVETPWVEKSETRPIKNDMNVLEMVELVSQYPDTRYLPPESVIFTPDVKYNGVQDCQTIFIQRKYQYSDMQDAFEEGIYVNIDKTSISKADNYSNQVIDGDLCDDESEREGVDAKSFSTEGYEHVDVIECFTKFRYKNKKTAEWRFWFTPVNNKVIRWHVSTIANRPLVRLAAEPFGDSMYPRGAMELMDNISIEMDTIMNQILQIQAINILPPAFIDSTTGFNAAEHVWGAGKFIPIRDPNQSIRFVNPPSSVGESMALFQQLFSLMQSLTSISDYLLGGGGSETATGVNALTRAAISNLQAIMGRLARGYQEVIEHVFMRIQQFASEAWIAKYNPVSANALTEVTKLSIADIRGQWDFFFVPELIQSSEAKRNEYNQFFQMAMPIIAEVPDGSMPDSSYYMLKKLFDVNGYEDLGDIVLGAKRGVDIDSRRGFSPEQTVIELANGRYPVPSVDEPHDQYLYLISEYMATPAYAEISEKAKGLFTRHVTERQQLMQQSSALADMANMPSGQNMQQPSATNAVPTPPQQQQQNAGELDARIQEGDARRLGQSRGI